MQHTALSIFTPATFLLLAHAAAAQEPPVRAAATDKAVDRAGRQVVSVDFRGGTLADFAAALRQAGQSVNIVLPETASKVPVPALVLRETSVDAALRAVTTVVESGVALHVETSQGTSPTIGPVGEPVYSVRVRHVETNRTANVTNVNTMNQGAEQSPPQRAVRVFALRGLVKVAGAATEGRLDTATVLTAIDTGLSVATELGPRDSDHSDPKAVVRYHEDSGLLFVAGTHMQLTVVDAVVSSLERQVSQERGASQPAHPPATDKTAVPTAADDKKKTTR